jgi:type III pantothenate kinase
MNWLIDLGNTRLKCAPLVASQRGDVRAFAHHDNGIDLDGLLALVDRAEPGDAVWLASVAPTPYYDAAVVVLAAQGYAVNIVRTQPRGQHLGGAIAPSSAHMRAALGQRFVALDLPAGRASEFADDTGDAIASGSDGAILGLIERSRRLAEVRLSVAPIVILSGGGAEAFAPNLPFPVEQSAWLVLDGLALFSQSEFAQRGEG